MRFATRSSSRPFVRRRGPLGVQSRRQIGFRRTSANEIETLKDKSPELERVYHEELGKARARSLGRELRDLGLNEAYFAIYDDRIVASGTSEEHVQQILDEIMPDGKETHPYIYHFDP